MAWKDCGLGIATINGLRLGGKCCAATGSPKVSLRMASLCCENLKAKKNSLSFHSSSSTSLSWL